MSAARRPTVRARARPRRDGRVPERAPAISRPARRRSPPHVPDRRGASRSRPIRRAIGRTAKVIRRYPHRARPRSRFRPLPIDPFPRAATRARQACESQGRPSPVFRAEPALRYIGPWPATAPPFRDRPLSLDTRPRALDREASLLPRSDGNARRAARECRAHRFCSATTRWPRSRLIPLGRDPRSGQASRREEQELRQRDQVFERRTFDAAKLQAIDHRRKIRDGDSPARVASGVDHRALRVFRPVRSAG